MLNCCSSSCASNRSLGAKREEADDAPGLLHLHLSVLCVFGVLVSVRLHWRLIKHTEQSRDEDEDCAATEDSDLLLLLFTLYGAVVVQSLVLAEGNSSKRKRSSMKG